MESGIDAIRSGGGEEVEKGVKFKLNMIKQNIQQMRQKCKDRKILTVC